MSSRSRSLSRSRSRSRSPRDRRFRTQRVSYRDAPYSRSDASYVRTANAITASNMAILQGSVLMRQYVTTAVFRDMLLLNAPQSPSVGTVGNLGIWPPIAPMRVFATPVVKLDIGHENARPEPASGDLRLCNNCFKQGHLAADCTNEKACKNCRKTGHIARECSHDPVCNVCNISGHVARNCSKSGGIGGGGFYGGGSGYPSRGFHGASGGIRSAGGGGFRDIVCRSCNQVGHISRDCMGGPMMICHNCGGRGHMAYECPSGRFIDRGPPRRY